MHIVELGAKASLAPAPGARPPRRDVELTAALAVWAYAAPELVIADLLLIIVELDANLILENVILLLLQNRRLLLQCPLPTDAAPLMVNLAHRDNAAP